MILECSLPGSRALCPGHPEGFETEDRATLFLPKLHHTRNHTALSVCQEFRKVALNKYRLYFDTPNIYANLNIDILFLIDRIGQYLAKMTPFGNGLKGVQSPSHGCGKPAIRPPSQACKESNV